MLIKLPPTVIRYCIKYFKAFYWTWNSSELLFCSSMLWNLHSIVRPLFNMPYCPLFLLIFFSLSLLSRCLALKFLIVYLGICPNSDSLKFLVVPLWQFSSDLRNTQLLFLQTSSVLHVPFLISYYSEMRGSSKISQKKISVVKKRCVDFVKFALKSTFWVQLLRYFWKCIRVYKTNSCFLLISHIHDSFHLVSMWSGNK